MTRYEKFKAMSIEEIAKIIIDYGTTGEYCKSDCEGIDKDEFQCDENREIQCCIRWLNEEVEKNEL